MSITKYEAIVYLANMAANLEPEISKYEINSVMDIMPRFYTAVKLVRSNYSYTFKEKSGELNESSAIDTLNQLPIRDRIEALAVCWLVINADGIVKFHEKIFIDNLAQKLSITDFDSIIKRAKRLTHRSIFLPVLTVTFIFIVVYFTLKALPGYVNFLH